MKSFQQFITEADELKDKEGTGHGTGTTHRGGDKIGRDRKKTAPEKKRSKAIGGGKTAPAKDYKKRSDVGKQRPKGRSTERQQQPTRERGSARLSLRDQQKKARAERLSGKSNKKNLDKAADKLLSKKPEGHVEAGRKRKLVKKDPNYKPPKASGYTAHERRKIRRAGERLVRDIKKGKEKHISHYDPKV
tara:strand:+ start:248 stop:817 length:570 start_codon:yes stop_codon:yes gene_type:complete